MAGPKFQGWLGKTADSVNGHMEWGEFEPKKWTEDDVDIEISHCGICGSDIHSTSISFTPKFTRLLRREFGRVQVFLQKTRKHCPTKQPDNLSISQRKI